MWQYINALIDCIVLKVKPHTSKIEKFYKKHCSKKLSACSQSFLKLCEPFLKTSLKSRKKILENNLFEKIRLLCVLVVVFFSAVLVYSGSCCLLLALFLNSLVIWFLFRGYRAAYLCALVCFLFELALAFNWVVLSVFVIAAAVLSWGFRIENTRISLEKSFQLRRTYFDILRDCVAASLLALFVLLVGFILFWICGESAQEKEAQLVKQQQLGIVAGTAARHLFGYEDFCKNQGYVLKNYPVVFAKFFAPEISKIDTALKKQGSSLQIFYQNAKDAFGRRLYNSIAEEIETIRQQAIVEMVSLKKNVNPQDVLWDSDIDGMISTTEACVLFDEMAESILLRPNASFDEMKKF